MKNGKASGIDNIPVELFKADVNKAFNILYDLFLSLWGKGGALQDWKKGIIIKLPKKGDLISCGNWRGITLLKQHPKCWGGLLSRG